MTIKWGSPELHMDTKRDLEGLHLYMIQYGIKTHKDGTTETVTRSMSEHVDRKRAKQIVDEIDRRLFGGVEYDGMPPYLK